MATLRAIKDRITSIKNTQKITRAMKMVAAAKVKKAENQTKASRPFASELYKIISALLADFEGEFKPIEGARPIENYPELLKDREIDTAGLVVISSNKGLAGAYSSNIVRYTIKRIKEEARKQKEAKKQAKLKSKNDEVFALACDDDDELPCDTWSVNIDEKDVIQSFTF